ncbi:hypothetical protein DOY81_010675 [Sarcophaga bullata]|nr:hypothetical protein DOY81_010675 [Sarcophaga bullata]
MLKKIFTILALIIVIIEIQNVNAFNSQRFKRSVKDLSPNCNLVNHLGKCLDQPTKIVQTLEEKFNNQNVKPKPYLQDKNVKQSTTTKAWYKFW